MGHCSTTCGTGELLKIRSKTVVEAHGGSCIGAATETESCTFQNCTGTAFMVYRKMRTQNTERNTKLTTFSFVFLLVVDCVWKSWDNWSSCSKTCGGGTKLRTRRVLIYEQNDGVTCPGESLERQDCNTENCTLGKNIWILPLTIPVAHI